MAKLTVKQKEICEYVRIFTKEQGYPPTVREIGAYLGLKSPSTVYFHLRKLRDSGIVHVTEGKTRSLILIEDQNIGLIPIVSHPDLDGLVLTEDKVEGYLRYDTDLPPGSCFAFRLEEDVMRRDGILRGDMVVVHYAKEPDQHDFVTVMIDGKLCVRRYEERKNAREPALLTADGDETYFSFPGVAPIGTVIGMVRQYKSE